MDEIAKLKAEVERLKKELREKKKYGLVWEPKTEDVVEMCKTKLPVLKEVKSKEIITDKTKPVNLLIEGDNYHALSVLNYTHAKKIDVIYIDPPYNTGAKDWKYNNHFVDINDTYRHTKWISLMEHRLKLAKDLLSNDGVICITIDDNELPRLWLLVEQIFHEFNHLGTIAIRNNPKGRMTARKVSLIHEYAIFFGRSKKSYIKKLPVTPEEKTHNYKKDSDGSWYLPVNLRKQGVDSSAHNARGKLSNRYYPIYYDSKTGQVSTKKRLNVEILPIDKSGQKRIWRRSKDIIRKMFLNGDLWIKKTKYGLQVYFKFRGGLEGRMPQSIWFEAKYSASEYGTKILDQILEKRELFQYPKSPHAVKDCILICSSKKDAVVLDFFAGSGTTGHAVLELNKKDEGIRQFILCTNNEDNNGNGLKIAEDICYPRIKKVIKGYSKVKGLGGNLKYFKTDFVEAEPTDDNKIKLTEQVTEMLCIKEDTFEPVLNRKKFKIFKSADHYTGIIFDQLAIPDFKKTIQSIKAKFSVYIFSLSDDTFDEEFEDIKQKVKLSPIPETILRVYRRIFK